MNIGTMGLNFLEFGAARSAATALFTSQSDGCWTHIVTVTLAQKTLVRLPFVFWLFLCL